MRLEDSEKLLHAIFPNYPSLQRAVQHRSGTDPMKAAQIGAISHVLITTETCRAFTFAEILIMTAMNVENSRLSSEGRVALTVWQRRADMLASCS
jgi:hypothetical protein